MSGNSRNETQQATQSLIEKLPAAVSLLGLELFHDWKRVAFLWLMSSDNIGQLECFKIKEVSSIPELSKLNLLWLLLSTHHQRDIFTYAAVMRLLQIEPLNILHHSDLYERVENKYFGWFLFVLNFGLVIVVFCCCRAID